ncbi:MAG TPA: DUF2284 domain-containing protein [Candidatus Coprenecus stercorigallinarum]|nr:DUF2284 domain-containing protein [Candidatus Coprenecus stercorigallinarum]
MTQDNTPGYTLREQWRTMPMKEYAETFRDFGRVRGYCHGCGRYGKCWACPPYDFAEEEYLGQFTTISLLATKITPSEGVALTPETAERILNRERQRLDRMLLGMEGNARAFFAGTCILCPPEKCTRREGLPCRHPESIRPSLEALGFDIARTASELFGIPLQWGSPGTFPAYLTLISAIARAPFTRLQQDEQTKHGRF